MAGIPAGLLTFLGVVYSSIFSLHVSIVSIVVVNCVAAFGLTIWYCLDLNRRTFVHYCSAILRCWFSLLMGHLELFGKMTIVLTGDAFVPDEAALVVCNHRSWADTVVMYSLARQVRMHGDVKFLAKRSLLLFPIFGFAGWILDAIIFIKRQSSSAVDVMTKVFSTLTNSRRERAPYWLINFLEGTRLTKDKLAAAHDFAKKRDLKVLNHVLQPRTKGFISTVKALRGNAKAVYDITLGYSESDNKEMLPSFSTMYFTPGLKERVIHVHQRRIPIKDLPTDEEELRKWIYALYEQKDELLCGFRQNGKFEGKVMRWNRISWAFWLRCQFIMSSVFAVSVYACYRVSQSGL